MTPEQFKAWRKDTMGYSQDQAAAALGISRKTVELYDRGARHGADPRPVEIPKTVELACMALRMGVTGFVET